ncbi:hypothetical protein LTR37_012286 [Vermiconidia calcicola]|uniref:Uncharacterized protein n=1 Tax=Vermiconidia calcicola TaxID=1690605 RepID=A0ACC3MZM4_9PEZI|nr:hypothetical protein LTR37_012286 [Vermiconidia calcicola]
MAKRKQAAATVATRPSKKRKAAEASNAKFKEIAEHEEYVSDEEEVTADTDYTETPVEIDANKLDACDVVDSDATPIVAPGFRLWETDSKLMASGGKTLQVTKVNKTTQNFSRILNVQYPELFSLVPMVITQGPYQGRHVFMLETTGGFRFMDFPAEIRTMIYSFLLEEDDTIEMTTSKRTNEARRPVRFGWNVRKGHEGLQWDSKGGKWLDQPPKALALLRVSKQMFEETASMMYGSNHFSFRNLGDLKFFLDAAGGMRRYLRHIHIAARGYQGNKVASVFRSLKDSIDLYTLGIDHTNLCQDGWSRYSHTTSAELFVYTVTSMFKVLREAREGTEGARSVLDIVKVEWKRCVVCQAAAPRFPANGDECRASPAYRYSKHNVKCEEAAKHCEEVEQEMRKLLARRLGLKE